MAWPPCWLVLGLTFWFLNSFSMKKIEHVFFNLSEEARNYISDCYSIAFKNTGSTNLAISVNNSAAIVAPGEILSLASPSLDGVITTVFDIRAQNAGDPVSCLIIKERVKDGN